MKKSKFLSEEMIHHDLQAEKYASRSEKDFIWEVPTDLFLLKRNYFFKGSKIIDFGCGPATLVKNILQKKTLSGIEYIGVDISKKMLNIAKRNIENGTFLQGDMESKLFKKEFADIILSLGALHHSHNQYKTIDQWLSILKPKGRILLREPIFEALKRGSGESPYEQGVKTNDLIHYLKKYNVRIKTLVFFTSPCFHLLNRIAIKVGLGWWQSKKTLWYVVILADVLLDKLLGKRFSFFHGLSFAMEIDKL